MKLIIASLLTGFIFLNVGGELLREEFLVTIFAIVGFLIPGLYVLEKIYKELKKQNNT